MKRSSQPDPALLKMIAWFIILAAVPYAWFAFSRAYTNIDSHSWPSVSAEVLSSNMYQRTGKRTDWCIKLSYRYHVDGRFYNGSRSGVSMIGNAGCDVDKTVVQQWLTTLVPGNAVRVYYDRDDPQHSAICLVALDAGDFAFCTTSLLFLAIGAFTLRHAKKLPPLKSSAAGADSESSSKT